MAEGKLFAGHAVKRLRRASGLTQAAMAEALGVSASYFNLIERNQRPLTAPILLRMAERYDFDPRRLGGATSGGGVEAIRRRLADPMFADLEIERSEVEEWLSAAPGGVEAFARLFDAGAGAGAGAGARMPVAFDTVAPVRGEIERWRNHFPDLEAFAETLSDELRMGSGDLYGAIAERLRVTHQLSIRILPVDVMPGTLRRLDLHARQLQLSELLDPASRLFSAAFQLGQLEAKDEIEALIRGANFADRVSERLYRRHLTSSFAASLMMPYDRFLRACEATGYDVELLQRRFGAGFEQVAHRLTTLSRVGSRGLPFFMLRIDRAGQVSKRYAGASASPLVEADGRCPLWDVHAAFDRPGTLMRQIVEIEDGSRWFTMSRTVSPQGGRVGQVRAQFAVGIGLDAALAAPLAASRGFDLKLGNATPVGLGCRACTRADCPQRAAPPSSRVLVFNERERGVSPFVFAAD
jgi:predicted transcriptional regulator